jgi:intracellular multiplication protein IcmL
VVDSLHAQVEKYVPRNNDFYRNHYHRVLYVLMMVILLLIIAVSVVLYQTLHRPLPAYHAMQADGKQMRLEPYTQPNLLPETILRWASKAAIVAYTFDFVNYRQEVEVARPYFTDAGWADFIRSLNPVVDQVIKNQLFVSGVVAGPPVIANQGPLPGREYAWRVQIPFLVTYQAAQTLSKRRFIVVLTIVPVPTNVNPQGIGIDQFVMV